MNGHSFTAGPKFGVLLLITVVAIPPSKELQFDLWFVWKIIEAIITF
jgi:hypothetical protein